MELFKQLLQIKGIHPEQNVLNLIADSGWLSARMMVVDNEETAWKLYQDATAIPQSVTRATVFEETHVKIDGIMPVAVQTAMLFYAFEFDIPKVLKVPQQKEKVSHECMMYFLHGEEVERLKLALVPVREIKLEGEHTKQYSSKKLFNKGILMPSYICTLASVPPPPSSQYVIQQGQRLCDAIKFMHQKGWLHGDVKPSNIFIGADGNCWLGDYGSSVPYLDIRSRYTGGTPKYQCEEVCSSTSPLKFDMMGLVLSFLSCYNIQHSTQTIAEVVQGVDQITDEEVKNFLRSLIGESDGKSSV